MKYCVSNRVSPATLEKADEIKVGFRDRRALPDYFEKYPDKDIILEIPPWESFTWDQMKNWNILSRGKLILCLGTTSHMQVAKSNGIRFYYGFPVNAAHELKPLMDLGVEYIKIGLPLFFTTSAYKDYPTRLAVNVAYSDELPRENGVNGIWVRPEDVDMYEGIIDVFEFEDVDIDKEELLFRVYAEDHEWRHSLDLLINRLNYPGNNRMILSDFTKYRLNCGQKCASDSHSCSICWRLLNLADPDKIREYRDAEHISIDDLPDEE